MGFIMEFAEYIIRRGMEDPEERDRRFRERLRDVKVRADKNKEYWKNPVKPYGYWNLDKFNSKMISNLQNSNELGRQDPYDIARQ